MNTIASSLRHCAAVVHPAEFLRSVVRRTVCTSLLLITTMSAFGEEETHKSTSELKNLTMDELLNFQVTSVSKKEENLVHAASAVQVITQEDIRRAGAKSIPEALRLVANLEVAQVDSRQWAISARGFNGTTSNKLLVMIDGRSIYTPLYSGVFWDVQTTLLEDIDRIEVISGPGGTLWGANAVNGVINIITKSAADAQGLLVSGGGGTMLHAFGGARYGTAIGDHTYCRVYAKYDNQGHSWLSDTSSPNDQWHQFQGGFRAETELATNSSITYQGDAYTGTFSQIKGGDVLANGANVLGRWTTSDSNNSSSSAQLYVDHTHRDIPNVFREDLNTLDADFQHRFMLNNANEIVFGLGFRLNDDHVVNSPSLSFLPPILTTRLFSGFLQDEIAIVENRLKFTVGSKIEHNDFSGYEVQPSGRLAYTISERQSLWGAVSRDVRTPSRIDRDFFIPAPFNLAGGPGFLSEKLIAYELGYRIQPQDNLTMSLATFYHTYDDLRSFENTSPMIFANGLTGKEYGAEFTGTYQPALWLRVSAGYTYAHLRLEKKPQSTDTASAKQSGDAPPHQVKLRALVDVMDRVQLDGSARYIDHLSNQGIPSYWEMDMRLAWQPTSRFEFSVTGQNLLHARHAEFGTAANRKELERSVYGKATWTL